MTKKIVFFYLLLLFSTNIYSQSLHQLSIAVQSEAIGLPFTNYSPIHPGIEFGAMFIKKEKDKNIQYFNAKAGFFYHQKLETAIYLGGEYQYSQKLFKQKVSIDIPVGLGYLHSFYPGEIYEQNTAGDFEKINQIGRSHLYINLGIGLRDLNEGKIQPFLRQELLLETPFANGIPAIPHSLLKVGVQIKL